MRFLVEKDKALTYVPLYDLILKIKLASNLLYSHPLLCIFLNDAHTIYTLALHLSVTPSPLSTPVWCWSRVLEVCVPLWLEVLVTLSHDGYPHVRSTAHSALTHFPAGSHTLSSLLGMQLHTLVSSLPRLIRHHDDTR